MTDTLDASFGPLAALRWLIEAGADEVIDEVPRNRLDAPTAAAPPPPAPARLAEAPAALPGEANRAVPAPTASPKRPAAVPIELESPDAAHANARELAAACATLEELKAAMARFDGCALRHTAKNLVFADGNPQAPVMFVGEAPGADEDSSGLPFVGVSGQLLDRMIGAIGLKRAENAYIANIIAWRPPGNRKPTSAEVTTCLPFIERHIELVNPKVLVLVGGTATSALLARAEGITKLRGRWLTWKDRVPTLALYHPAYLLRTPAMKRQAWQDLQALRRKLTELGG